ncbi:hypothetical protein [Adhaeribacter aerolatus]|nr:hypothetical protein [Adhaeribacter aerolatus]
MKEKDVEERIVARYLTNDMSYIKVADEGGVDYRSLHCWVKD